MADVTGTVAMDFGGMSIEATGRAVKTGTVAMSFGGMSMAVTGRTVRTGTVAMDFGGMTLAVDTMPEDKHGTVTMFLGI